MKQHSTNYFDTFVEVAEDTKTATATKPPEKDKKTVAKMQFDMISKNPYKYTSDDVLFQVYAERNGLTEAQLDDARTAFFSKGQPCFRASPLTKTYGYGIHHNSEGKTALYRMNSAKYQKFQNDPKLKKVKAMKSSK